MGKYLNIGLDGFASLRNGNYIDKSMLISYINDFKPFDKAGSYGIQELPEGFVTNVNGDYYNIVGFPVALVEKVLSAVRT